MKSIDHGNRRPHRLLGVAAAFSLMVGCAPAIDPAAKASVDRQVAQVQQRDVAFGPSGAQPPEPQAGHWSTYKVVDANGRPSFMTYKIVRREGKRLWFEVDQETYHGPQSFLCVYEVEDARDPETFEPQSITLMDDGRITELSGSDVALARSTYPKAFEMVGVHWEGLPRENARVPAGTFREALRGEREVRIGGARVGEMTLWLHSEVPVNGMVRSVSSNGTTIELVDFGTTGATPTIPLD